MAWFCISTEWILLLFRINEHSLFNLVNLIRLWSSFFIYLITLSTNYSIFASPKNQPNYDSSTKTTTKFNRTAKSSIDYNSRNFDWFSANSYCSNFMDSWTDSLSSFSIYLVISRLVVHSNGHIINFIHPSIEIYYQENISYKSNRTSSIII